MKLYALSQIGNLGYSYLKPAFREINTGRYDTEWQKGNKTKLDSFIQSLKDKWEEKQSVTLIHGDFQNHIKNIPDNSIDLIITDPPYNLKEQQVFEYKDEHGNKLRTDKTFKFDDWDNEEDEVFLNNFHIWLKEFRRIMKDKASCYVFTGDRYISHLRRMIEKEGFKYKATLTWNRTNPGTSMVKTNYISATDYILFFTKCESGHTFNWDDNNYKAMLTHYTTSTCSGAERIRDDKNNILHPTQKPEEIIARLMEISSYRGDMVFDGFMGVGTTPAVAKKLGRKCIGIEKDKAYYETAVRRLQEIK
jgi:DNA modification methylase